MVRRLAVVLMVASLALVLFPPTGHAAGKEQIVFSGEGDGSFGEVGFWVWCAVDEAGAYDDCSGALHFDDLGIARHVEGEVSEPNEGQYVMDLASTRDDAVACTLTNTPPIRSGPNNRIDVSCSTPSGTATASDAVIGGNA